MKASLIPRRFKGAQFGAPIGDAAQVGCLEGTLHFPQRGKAVEEPCPLSLSDGLLQQPPLAAREMAGRTDLPESYREEL